MSTPLRIISYILAAAISVLIYHFATHSGPSRVGYVRTGLLLEKYEGMKNANEQFTAEMGQMSSNLDTLKSRYEKLLAEKQSGAGSGDIDKRIATAEAEYNNYARVADTQMETMRSNLTKGVVDKVNLFIRDYGKAHGFKMILGTTSDGNILYGTEEDDITDEILEELNKKE